MAVSVIELATLHTSDNETKVVSVTFDDSYPNTGGTVGEPFDADMVNLDRIDAVIVAAGSTVATKHAVWTPSTQCLRLYVEDAVTGISAEAANASDQSAVTITAIVVGK